MTEPPTILALVPDLMFGVRVRDVLRHMGYQASVVEDVAAACAVLHPALALVIIDLRGEMAGWQSLIAQAKALDSALPILAFGSHIDAERIQAARTAGCDRVVANSAFAANLPALIEGLARSKPAA